MEGRNPPSPERTEVNPPGGSLEDEDQATFDKAVSYFTRLNEREVNSRIGVRRVYVLFLRPGSTCTRPSSDIVTPGDGRWSPPIGGIRCLRRPPGLIGTSVPGLVPLPDWFENCVMTGSPTSVALIFLINLVTLCGRGGGVWPRRPSARWDGPTVAQGESL